MCFIDNWHAFADHVSTCLSPQNTWKHFQTQKNLSKRQLGKCKAHCVCLGAIIGPTINPCYEQNRCSTCRKTGQFPLVWHDTFSCVSSKCTHSIFQKPNCAFYPFTFSTGAFLATNVPCVPWYSAATNCGAEHVTPHIVPQSAPFCTQPPTPQFIPKNHTKYTKGTLHETQKMHQKTSCGRWRNIFWGSLENPPKCIKNPLGDFDTLGGGVLCILHRRVFWYIL